MKTLFTIFILFGSLLTFSQGKPSVVGAWKYENGDTTIALIITEKHFAETTYDFRNKKFISTAGGSWATQNGRFTKLYEFSSAKPELIGQQVNFTLQTNAKAKLGLT